MTNNSNYDNCYIINCKFYNFSLLLSKIVIIIVIVVGGDDVNVEVIIVVIIVFLLGILVYTSLIHIYERERGYLQHFTTIKIIL